MGDPVAEPCGCCAGVDSETPARIDNPPGQPAIAYRVGVHARFKESLLARLSDTELPALGGLTTREDSDFTIALCDALATGLDVLTFYQERLANEHYLRTATERRSILELARLVGYRLAPGVAATTHLAFSLQEAPGNPALAAGPVQVPVGTRVQSVPGQDEQPQTFETVEAVEARAEWNAIPVESARPWRPQIGDRELWLAGVGRAVQPGDAILIVGQERVADTASPRWDIRLITGVQEDTAKQRTRLAWDAPIGAASPRREPAGAGAAVYVFRQRAALFGHNAPDPRLLFKNVAASNGLAAAPTLLEISVAIALGTSLPSLSWVDYRIDASAIDLDAPYPKIIPESWFALVSNSGSSHPSGFSGAVELYRASAVGFPSRSGFALSGKVTRLTPDRSDKLGKFGIQTTLLMAQSEPLAVTAPPSVIRSTGVSFRSPARRPTSVRGVPSR